MENKYYTPTIDEFHVGFTYERNDGNDWYPVVSNIGDMMDVQTMLSKANLQKIAITCKDEKEFLAKTGAHALPIGMTLKTILNNPITFCDRIRVKYLDREDIESLEWDLDDCSPGRYEYKDYIMYNFNNSNIFTIKVKRSFIKYGETFINFDVLFEGTIKNKSELKQIMKCLNI